MQSLKMIINIDSDTKSNNEYALYNTNEEIKKFPELEV